LTDKDRSAALAEQHRKRAVAVAETQRKNREAENRHPTPLEEKMQPGSLRGGEDPFEGASNSTNSTHVTNLTATAFPVPVATAAPASLTEKKKSQNMSSRLVNNNNNNPAVATAPRRK
jgi:hypothetical protein